LVELLPSDWKRGLMPASTVALGSQWAKEKVSLALKVPSIIVPSEFNFLINPLHPNFEGLIVEAAKPFRLDPRLLPGSNF
jgi:RES domain-containing protein